MGSSSIWSRLKKYVFLRDFWSRLNKYGYIRLVSSRDVVFSLLLAGIPATLYYFTCVSNTLGSYTCYNISNMMFVGNATSFAVTLTAFILTGLSVVIAFTDERFISELSKIDIYDNILFVFEYNMLTAVATSIVGIVVQSYRLSVIGFFVFLFFFIHMVLSITELIQIVVDIGTKKGQYEEIRARESDDQENSAEESLE
jgi:hypothetical protein